MIGLRFARECGPADYQMVSYRTFADVQPGQYLPLLAMTGLINHLLHIQSFDLPLLR
jgi:hypothetical protein